MMPITGHLVNFIKQEYRIKNCGQSVLVLINRPGIAPMYVRHDVLESVDSSLTPPMA